MAKIYGQLQNAQLEVKTSDYSAGVKGRVWWNDTNGQINSDDGTNVRSLLRNDGKIVIGTNGTANNNIRFHRGASGVLQFVTGGNATAEGTLATTLNQISFRAENYTTGARPAAANAGRLIWNSTTGTVQADSGSTWIDISIGTNTVSNANFRQSAGLSVVGVTGSSTANVADITGTDGQVLRVSGFNLAFGTIVAAGIASNAVTTAKILDANVTLAKLDAAANLTVAKVWVNFNAVPASGTYSRSGTTITVTLTSHGMTTGMLANLDFTTGTASDGTYAITNTGANTFTVVDAVSGSTSGNVTRNLYIRSSYNVSSTLGITDNGVGDWTVNFANALTDVNYAAIPSVGGTAGGSIIETADDSTARTTTAIRLVASTRSGGAAVDEAQIGLIIMGN